LVADIEALREHLKIDRWIVFGGSWGSTLTLAYSQKHPDRCLGLIVRGIFTLRKEELNWFYQKGADMLFPDYFEPYKAAIPVGERGDMMKAYHKRLTGDNEEEKLKWCVVFPLPRPGRLFSSGSRNIVLLSMYIIMDTKLAEILRLC
jgi:proline iminopeptidase